MIVCPLTQFGIAANAIMLATMGAQGADRHPIVEVKTGYSFGARAAGKWIKAAEAMKS